MFFNHPLYIEDIMRTANNSACFDLQKSHVLVTGASGLIGTFLIDVLMYLNEKNKNTIKVYALGRSRAKMLEHFSCYLNSPYFTIIEHDICNPFEQEFRVDYVFHGASNTHPLSYASEPVNTILTSVTGTANVLDFAARVGVKRVVFLSTVEVYGENRGDTELFDEMYCGYLDCNTLRAGYPEGKRTAEALCHAYMKEHRLNIVIARLCRIYGPTMSSSDSKVIAQFIRNAVQKHDIVLKSAGSQEYSYAYVADACSALLFLLLHGQNGQVYNIANSECLSLSDIAHILAKHINKKVLFDLPDEIEKIGFSPVTKALLDNMKIRNEGWYPQYSLQDGLCRTIAILQSML